MFNDLGKLFGIEFDEEEITAPKGLPVYMTSGRKTFRLSLEDWGFIVICIPEMDRFGVVALKKQHEQYEKCFDSHVAFSFSGISKIQRDSLIKHRVPFIAQPIQIYLPFLGTMLTSSYRKEKELSIEKIMPATQSLYLFLLSKGGESVSKVAAANALGLTKMSISRASEQLEEVGLIIQENAGRSVLMRPKAYGRRGYELAKPYLINPVKETIIVKASDNLSSLPFAGETALSSYSMLGEPAIQTKAVSKDSDIIASLKRTDEKWDPESQCIRLQLWKYDPSIFSKDGIVDRISLAMSFTDNIDERIEDALDYCLEGLDG
ncbi:MAG: MarR family transcriptional regulator [Lachnospiraceae bacterium]|nr:MarR family transcriptional regulator [Lachnospiraceae bacterium]